MTRPTLRHHATCMALLRALEECDPKRPIGHYFAQAQRYCGDRIVSDDPHGQTFYRVCLAHLKAGCPSPLCRSWGGREHDAGTVACWIGGLIKDGTIDYTDETLTPKE